MVALNKEQRRKTTSFFFYLVNCPDFRDINRDDLSFSPISGKNPDFGLNGRRLGKLLEAANGGTIPLISAWQSRLSSALNKIQISDTDLGANIDTESPQLARAVHMFANVRPD